MAIYVASSGYLIPRDVKHLESWYVNVYRNGFCELIPGAGILESSENSYRHRDCGVSRLCVYMGDEVDLIDGYLIPWDVKHLESWYVNRNGFYDSRATYLR